MPRAFVLALFCLWRSAAVFAGVVLPMDTSWQYLPGRSEASPGDPTAWRELGFDDSSWAKGQAPFFYENQPTSATAYTGNTVLADMSGGYSCVSLRKEFVLTSPADIQEMDLQAMCDDGFIAWLNGTEVARFNMPLGEIPYNGTASGALSEPVPQQNITLDRSVLHLVAGTNVLAVQAFNSSLSGSSDFVFWATLSSDVDEQPPTVATLIPEANALLRQLTQIEVIFSENVAGVEAGDLLVNGQPATNLTAFSGSQYLFEFAQPAEGQVQCAWRFGQQIHDLSSGANSFAGGNWTYTLAPNAPAPGLEITEFMADNKKTLRDEDGDSSDWIEIHNAGSTTASLLGYGLTVQSGTNQWRFPNVSLRPDSYLVVFASEKNRTDPTRPLHTNFKLDKAGGNLALLDAAGNPVSTFNGYPSQLKDVSYGRDRVNPTLEAFFPNPTPGAPNSVGGPGFSPAVAFSRPGGSFVEPFDLQLSTGATNAAIHYTLDGSLPSESSPIYSDRIRVGSTVQVRAISFTPSLLPGPPHSETYLALSSNVLSFTSDLPVVVIDNFGSGAVPASIRQFAQIALFEPGQGRTSLTNAATLSVRAGINLRGSSTLYEPKSNFRVEFWDDFGEGEDHSVLGMPSDNDWVLYGPDNFEPVLIHNPFMFDLSRQIGRYAPGCRFVEVYLNTKGGPITPADYNGVYVLMEKIKRSKDRVDIDALQPEQSLLPEVTGGYLLSIDRSAPGEGQLYAGGTGVNALDPGWDELNEPQRAPQMRYITDYLNQFQASLNSASFTNPATGYAKFVDIDSAIDHHILNILAFNVDALRLSSYFYKPRAAKLGFGPLWDFDRALGSTDGRDANPRVWRSTSSDRGTDMFNADSIFSNPWYSRMFRDPDFWQRWIDRWQDLRRNEFSLTNLYALVDTLANQVREAERREIVRWPGYTTPRGGSYQAEVDRMKNWLSNRVDFIDTNFLAAPLLGAPAGSINPGFALSLSGPDGATLYYTLDGTDPRAPGGAVAPSAHTYSGPIALAQNARVVARAWDANHHNLTGASKPPLSSPWSGPVAATYVLSTPALVITEIMYHPPATSLDSTNDPEAFEFVELRNRGVAPINLAGFSFTQGISYTFAPGTGPTVLAPGQYGVLVKNRAAFSSRYPSVTNIVGEYLGSLDNSGERLTLVGPLQEPILDFKYDNAWAPLTDGLGYSMVVADDNALLSAWVGALGWTVSQDRLGSPGCGELPDSDQDGLPDAWEIAHGLDPHSAIGKDGPAGDPDGDGLSNWEEYLGGTDPQDPQSALAFRSVHWDAGQPVLQFHALAGRNYAIFRSDSLGQAAWTKLADIPSAETTRLVDVKDPASVQAPGRFYRLVAE